MCHAADWVMLNCRGQARRESECFGSFDPDIAKRDGRVRIRLDADKSCWGSVNLGDASLRIGVVDLRSISSAITPVLG
jgi:hypothetical protein